ncbi:2'-5' RNA ligase superfamily protein [Rhizobium mongolense subsp. loessense]|uniref:2'-5' RNA ligase superfamily protein n=1 Tax=Rhizobium mongolense subsp. loessense TaxID=158890 RepID=A0A1G4RB55_9HYPH|nr:2'-5' RNA ligase superfamily protein [Rhizobium mongolense subsp. loessense]
MPHAISLKCLNETALPIVELWQEASAFEPAPSMKALDYPAHVTLAVYEDFAPTDVLTRILGTQSAIPVTFSGIRYFQNEFLVLWARPVSNGRLLQLHAAVHSEIDPALCREHYRPDFWVPHCTIAMKIPGAMFEPAIKWASEKQAEFSVTFDALDIVRFAPVEILSEVKLTTQ